MTKENNILSKESVVSIDNESPKTNLWLVRDYDPETDEAPEGDPEHDCDGTDDSEEAE